MFSIFFLRSSPKDSSLNKELRPATWEVRFAPPPEDIYWENLNRSNYRIIKVKLNFITRLFITILRWLEYVRWSVPNKITKQIFSY